MQKLLLFLCLSLAFIACKKLERKIIKLDVNCNTCMQFLKDSVENIDGIYLSQYDIGKTELMIKYDPQELKEAYLYELLHEEGFIKSKVMFDSSEVKLPDCCNIP